MTSIAVALSGGGHRASLFGLGVLLYLADAGKNREITSISSVSGGSLTNGFVAQELDYQSAMPTEFWEVAAKLAKQIVQRGTLWASQFTWLYLAILVGSLAAIVGVWWLTLGWAIRAVLFVLLIGAWAILLAGQRGRVCGRAFAETLFAPTGRRTRLRDLERAIDHVICVTHLNAGEHVYFSAKFVYSYRFGWGTPKDFPLHAAVQASAAYPAGFPALLVPTSGFDFQGRSEVPALMALTDGGVYDNMADQWPMGVARRKRKWGKLAGEAQEPDVVIVVNSSAGLQRKGVGHLFLPLMSELHSLRRVISIMYDNSASLRRSSLVAGFDRAAKSGEGLRGALVHIEQSPFRVPDYFRDKTDTWPERAARAKGALDCLAREDRTHWKEVCGRNASFRTTLRRIPPPVALDLIQHSYLLAMVNLHVILGFPLLPIPDRGRFEGLLA